jgi:hypothetical protein
MRKLILAMMAAAIITAPMATVVKAEDTTVIKKIMTVTAAKPSLRRETT